MHGSHVSLFFTESSKFPGACLKKAAKSNKQLFDVELHCKVDCEHSPDKKRGGI